MAGPVFNATVEIEGHRYRVPGRISHAAAPADAPAPGETGMAELHLEVAADMEHMVHLCCRDPRTRRLTRAL